MGCASIPVFPHSNLGRCSVLNASQLGLSADIPDATTLGRLRQQLVDYDLLEKLLGEVNRQLEGKHIIMTQGRINIIDATPVEAAQPGQA